MVDVSDCREGRLYRCSIANRNMHKSTKPQRDQEASEDEVILVDEHDNVVGTMAKMEAHRRGALHRAFSVFLYNARGDLLLQKRAEGKYHSPGQWTNTCCSHPRPGEEVLAAAARRLMEEMGVSCPLQFVFTVLYRVELRNGLAEHELDHVLIGTFEGEPAVEPREVAGWRFVPPQQIAAEVAEDPRRFTPWFRLILPQLQARLEARDLRLPDLGA